MQQVGCMQPAGVQDDLLPKELKTGTETSTRSPLVPSPPFPVAQTWKTASASLELETQNP